MYKLKEMGVVLLMTTVLCGCSYAKSYQVIKLSYDDLSSFQKHMTQFDQYPDRVKATVSSSERKQVEDNFQKGYFDSAEAILQAMQSDPSAIKTIHDNKQHMSLVYRNLYAVSGRAGRYYCGQAKLEQDKSDYRPFVVALDFASNSASSASSIYQKYCTPYGG